MIHADSLIPQPKQRHLLPLFFVVEIDILDPVLVKEIIEARFQVLPTAALFGRTWFRDLQGSKIRGLWGGLLYGGWEVSV